MIVLARLKADQMTPVETDGKAVVKEGWRPGWNMPNIDSLTFDLTDCSLGEQSESHRRWMNSAGLAYLLRFNRGRLDWPFDLTKLDAATDYFTRQCGGNGGVMLSMHVSTVAGSEALCGLFKYRAPIPGSRAMYYVGIIWLPFQQCRFQVNVEAIEMGSTGTREAAVMLIDGDKWPKMAADMPVRQLPSDDERYDQEFPGHPLSQVRARLAKVMETARLDVSGATLTPFRVRRGWW